MNGGSQSAQECAVTQKKVLLWTSCKALSGVSTSHCFKLFKGLVFPVLFQFNLIHKYKYDIKNPEKMYIVYLNYMCIYLQFVMHCSQIIFQQMFIFYFSMTPFLVYETKSSDQSSDTIQCAITNKLSTCSLRWDLSDICTKTRTRCLIQTCQSERSFTPFVLTTDGLRTVSESERTYCILYQV